MAAKLGVGGAALAGALGAGRCSSPALAAGGLPEKKYKFVFVNHVTTNEFFTPTIYGIQDACAFFGASYQWTGSQNSVVSEMVNAMQIAIAQKADGIAVCLIDAKAFDAAHRQRARRRHSGDRLQCRRAEGQPEPASGLCGAAALRTRLRHRDQSGCRWCPRAAM